MVIEAVLGFDKILGVLRGQGTDCRDSSQIHKGSRVLRMFQTRETI